MLRKIARRKRRTILALTLASVAVLAVLAFFVPGRFNSKHAAYSRYLATGRIADVADFSALADRFDNRTGFGLDRPIVPNIIHFIKFRDQELTFVELVNVLAAWKHHRPDRLLIHCDCRPLRLRGKYWEILRQLRIREIQLSYLAEPLAVFGRPLSSVYHAGDVAKLQVLMEHGGIVLDFDVYTVQSLNMFRSFECSVSWPYGDSIGAQVIVAHRKARFIHMWLDSYRHYRPYLWYYNAGQLPTKILEENPSLVHREPELLGTHYLIAQLYKQPTWPEWKTFFTIHLLARHRKYLDKDSPIPLFDECNIRGYLHPYGELARLVLYGNADAVTDPRIISNISACHSQFK